MKMVQQGYQKISKSNKKPRAATNETIRVHVHIHQQLL